MANESSKEEERPLSPRCLGTRQLIMRYSEHYRYAILAHYILLLVKCGYLCLFIFLLHVRTIRRVQSSYQAECTCMDSACNRFNLYHTFIGQLLSDEQNVCYLLAMRCKTYVTLLSMLVFLGSCSSWKNLLVSPMPPTQYVYRGDTVQQWSLIRLDSMGGPWGYISTVDKRAIRPVFDWADDFSDSMALVYYQGRYTYVNHQGKQMRRINAHHAYPFSEGLAAVQHGDQWGYINHRGKWVIKPQFDWALSFSHNRAAVARGNQYGFVNRCGQMIITPQYEDTKPFANDLSIVKKNGKYGLIDTLGREILPNVYRYIEPWEKGTYRLHVGHKKMGLADPQGQLVLDTIYTTISIQHDNFLHVVRDRLAGLVDFRGREIWPTAYTFLGFISDEGFLAAVKDGKYGIVDTAGKTLLPFIYDDGQAGFVEGRITVYQGNKLLLMDTAFQIIKELRYNRSYAFSNGFALVEAKRKKDYDERQLGYINRRGEEIIPPQYHSAYRFNRNGLAIVGLRKEGISTYMVIDSTGMRCTSRLPTNHPAGLLHSLKPFGNRLFYNDSGSKSLAFFSSRTGRYIPDLPYTAFSPLKYSDREDLAKVRIGWLVGLIDTAINEILPVQFEDISTYKGNRIAVKQNGKWGFADEKFRFRIPFVYDKVSAFHYGYATAYSNTKQGIIDPKGRTIIPLQYKNTTVDSLSNRVYAIGEQGSDVYDRYGRLLLRSEYEYIGGFWGKHYSTFRQGGKMGILDDNFHIICQPEYDHIGPFYDGRAWVIKGQKGGFVNSAFRLVIPIEYDCVEAYALGFTRVEKDGEAFYIDVHGKRIQPSDIEIAERRNAIERRNTGFFEFSS